MIQTFTKKTPSTSNSTFAQKLARFLTDQSAATAVEYAILLALIAAVLMAGAFAAGGVSANTWGGNAQAIEVINP